MSKGKLKEFREKQAENKKKHDEKELHRFVNEQQRIKRQQRIENTKSSLQTAKKIVAKILPDNKKEEYKPPHAIYW